MTRWEAFIAVCGHLRAGLLSGPPFAWDPRTPWELLVELSSRHNVNPALAWCLAAETAVAADVRGYFDAVVDRNRKRNEQLLDRLARVVGALNAIDIEPVLLKGAAHLVEGIYPATGLRVVGDLDVLIPEDRGAHSAAALAAIGFVASTTPVPDGHLHLPTMYDETGVDVELHTRVEHAAAHAIVPTPWFRQSTRPFPFRGMRVRLPEATRSIAHNIVHSQIDHELDRINRIELRHLLDVAVIRAQCESAVDWDEIDRRFSAAGFADVLATYLSAGEILFGQPMPRLSGQPRAAFFEAFRASVERVATKRPKRLTAPPRPLDHVRRRLVERHAGFVDQVATDAGITAVRGWAADLAAKGPARSCSFLSMAATWPHRSQPASEPMWLLPLASMKSANAVSASFSMPARRTGCKFSPSCGAACSPSCSSRSPQPL